MQFSRNIASSSCFENSRQALLEIGQDSPSDSRNLGLIAGEALLEIGQPEVAMASVLCSARLPEHCLKRFSIADKLQDAPGLVRFLQYAQEFFWEQTKNFLFLSLENGNYDGQLNFSFDDDEFGTDLFDPMLSKEERHDNEFEMISTARPKLLKDEVVMVANAHLDRGEISQAQRLLNFNNKNGEYNRHLSPGSILLFETQLSGGSRKQLAKSWSVVDPDKCTYETNFDDKLCADAFRVRAWGSILASHPDENQLAPTNNKFGIFSHAESRRSFDIALENAELAEVFYRNMTTIQVHLDRAVNLAFISMLHSVSPHDDSTHINIPKSGKGENALAIPATEEDEPWQKLTNARTIISAVEEFTEFVFFEEEQDLTQTITSSLG